LTEEIRVANIFSLDKGEVFMDFDRNSLRKLQTLSRIQCKPEEQEALLESLQNILKHMEQLSKVNTENVTACNHVLGELHYNITRPDALGPLRSREEFLNNSPSHVGGMIRVPPILKKE
jgi:aspartyl-tRNA(Asn)/glutamyl-tRNA(Gln) amidotransferase subunit C